MKSYASLLAGAAWLCLLATGAAFAQSEPAAPAAPSPGKSPESFKPADDSGTPDTWIFAGVLESSHETFSGTLVANKGQSDFEMKLGGGATCDGGQLKGEVGLVRLPEITCTDDRKLRALFVPQEHQTLKVFGHVGDERFAAEAHLLGTEAPPEPKQTSQPKGPLGLPPPAVGAPPK